MHVACRNYKFLEWTEVGNSLLYEELAAALSQVEGSLLWRLRDLREEAEAARLLLQRALGQAGSSSGGAQHSGYNGASLSSLLWRQQEGALATELERLSAQLRKRAEQAREELSSARLMEEAKLGMLGRATELLANDLKRSNDPWQLGANLATAAAWAQWRVYDEEWETRCQLLHRISQLAEEGDDQSQDEAVQLIHHFYTTPYRPGLSPRSNSTNAAFQCKMKEVMWRGAVVPLNVAAAGRRELEGLSLAACRGLRLLGEQGAAEIAGMRLREEEEARRVAEVQRWRTGDAAVALGSSGTTAAACELEAWRVAEVQKWRGMWDAAPGGTRPTAAACELEEAAAALGSGTTSAACELEAAAATAPGSLTTAATLGSSGTAAAALGIGAEPACSCDADEEDAVAPGPALPSPAALTLLDLSQNTLNGPEGVTTGPAPVLRPLGADAATAAPGGSDTAALTGSDLTVHGSAGAAAGAAAGPLDYEDAASCGSGTAASSLGLISGASLPFSIARWRLASEEDILAAAAEADSTAVTDPPLPAAPQPKPLLSSGAISGAVDWQALETPSSPVLPAPPRDGAAEEGHTPADDEEVCDDGGGCEVDEDGDPRRWDEDGEHYWGEEEEEEEGVEEDGADEDEDEDGEGEDEESSNDKDGQGCAEDEGGCSDEDEWEVSEEEEKETGCWEEGIDYYCGEDSEEEYYSNRRIGQHNSREGRSF